jgi:23S rRNA-intervening sequence protein
VKMAAKEINEAEEVEEVKETAAQVGPVKNYGDLLPCQQAYRLAWEVSKLTKRFPLEEQFELGRQLRRSASSAPANVVAGWTKRNSAAEFETSSAHCGGRVGRMQVLDRVVGGRRHQPKSSGQTVDRKLSEIGLYDSQTMEGVEKTVA